MLVPSPPAASRRGRPAVERGALRRDGLAASPAKQRLPRTTRPCFAPPGSQRRTTSPEENKTALLKGQEGRET